VRLAWSQAAPSQAALNGYGFILFVDGSRMSLSGVSCSGAATDYDCAAPLPSLSAGAHVLEMATVDNAAGLESQRSASIVFNGSTTNPRTVTSSTDVIEPHAPAPMQAPWLTCFSGDSSTCFAVSPVATDLPEVERIATLPDNRVLAVFAGGVVQVLPDGEPQRVDVNRGQAVNIAAVAIDPEFVSNRFVYLATVAPSADGRNAVTIVRMRELAGSLGDAATIAVDLPAAQGRPAMSIGPDRRIYLALPSAGGQRSRGGPYDGLVLRLTRDGSAAGYERMNSPVLAVGSDRPSSFAWLDDEHLVLASSGVPQWAAAGLVPLSVEGAWPAPLTPLSPGGSGRLGFSVQEIAAVPAAADDPLESRLFVLGLDPAALYLARLTAGPRTDVRSVNAIPLGTWTPLALGVDAGGDAIVAARKTGEIRLSLLRVHAR
jgi:hypothetical protein